MIEYGFRVFGFGTLARVQGSSVYRSIIPALLSVTILLIYTYCFQHPSGGFTQHPYVYQVLVAAVTFLITFRTNFAYGRVSFYFLSQISNPIVSLHDIMSIVLGCYDGSASDVVKMARYLHRNGRLSLSDKI